MVAAGGADGCVTWINGARAATRARKAVRSRLSERTSRIADVATQRVAQQTLYRLDYSRVSGLYRMVDGFAPEVSLHSKSFPRY